MNIEEKNVHKHMNDLLAIIENQVRELEKYEGELIDARTIGRSSISIKFKSGHAYWVGISKQNSVSLDD